MRDIEIALTLRKRAFYERYTETLRLCPENYCLAHKAQKKWCVYRDEGATRKLHDKIQEALDTWQNGSTAEAIADELGKLFRFA